MSDDMMATTQFGHEWQHDGPRGWRWWATLRDGTRWVGTADTAQEARDALREVLSDESERAASVEVAAREAWEAAQPEPHLSAWRTWDAQDEATKERWRTAQMQAVPPRYICESCGGLNGETPGRTCSTPDFHSPHPSWLATEGGDDAKADR